MSANGISTRVFGLHTVIRVQSWPTSEQHPRELRVYTTRDLPAGSQRGTFAAPDDDAIGKRAASGGSDKGRILWAVQWANFQPHLQVGALLLHVPVRRRQPLMILRMMVTEELLEGEAAHIRTRLLACAKQCAIELGRANGALAWNIPIALEPSVCQLYAEFRPTGQRIRDRTIVRWD